MENFHNNFNKETNSNEYSHYCHKIGDTTENCFFSTHQIHQIKITMEEKKNNNNNNNESRNEKKNKGISLRRKGSNGNFKKK